MDRKKKLGVKRTKSAGKQEEGDGPPPITWKEIAKKSIAKPNSTRKGTKDSLGNASDRSTNSNKISNKSKSSNKSRLSSKSKGSNKSNASKGKGRLSIARRKSKVPVPQEGQTPKRNFNFGQDGGKRSSAESGEKKSKKRKSSDGSRRLSKTSKGSGKKGSLGSNKGERKGSHAHKKDHEGHLVPIPEEKTHIQSEELKHVHFQLRYNDWTYFDHVPDSSRVLDLKFRIYMYTRIQPYKQKLYLVRRKLKEPKLIEEYGLISDWYDADRPALLFLKYKDKCVEKLPKEDLHTPPVQSPETITDNLESPDLVVPPSTPISDTVPAVTPKKGKKDAMKIGPAKPAKDTGKMEVLQSEPKIKPKATITSVQSNEEKGKEKGEADLITMKSKSQFSESDRDSSGNKQSNTNAARKKQTPSIANRN